MLQQTKLKMYTIMYVCNKLNLNIVQLYVNCLNTVKPFSMRSNGRLHNKLNSMNNTINKVKSAFFGVFGSFSFKEVITVLYC